MRDRGGDVRGLVATAGPGPLAGTDASEVEAERVPPALGAGARDRGDERIAHLAAVRRKRMSDDDDRARRGVGHAQRSLEAAIDPLGLFPHHKSVAGRGVRSRGRGNPRGTPLYRLRICATWPQPQLDSVGVRTGGHTNVTIRNGKISQFSTGIYFVDMEKSRIEDVTSERNRFGFYFHASKQNAIRRSTVVANIYGLHLQDANDNLIEGNNLIRQTYNSPGGFGIYLYRSTGNRIIQNTIENNVNWGIWFSDAKGNTIFHNNVSGNSPQVSDNNPDANQWFDPDKKEGNWWADYKGTDADKDFIGDTPYGILGPGGAVDAYPFTERDGWNKKSRSTVAHYHRP